MLRLQWEDQPADRSRQAARPSSGLGERCYTPEALLRFLKAALSRLAVPRPAAGRPVAAQPARGDHRDRPEAWAFPVPQTRVEPNPVAATMRRRFRCRRAVSRNRRSNAAAQRARARRPRVARPCSRAWRAAAVISPTIAPPVRASSINTAASVDRRAPRRTTFCPVTAADRHFAIGLGNGGLSMHSSIDTTRYVPLQGSPRSFRSSELTRRCRTNAVDCE